MAARKDNPPRPLSHEDIDFLKALLLATDHMGAFQREGETLEVIFRNACTDRGLEPATIRLAIEALC